MRLMYESGCSFSPRTNFMWWTMLCYLFNASYSLTTWRSCSISKAAFSHMTVLSTVLREAFACIENHIFVNRPSCYVISQQQLQWAAHVVPWLASTQRVNVEGEAHIVLLCKAPDNTDAHWIKQQCWESLWKSWIKFDLSEFYFI